MKTVNQSTIYIGLNDADAHTQLHGTERYLSILKQVCYHYRAAFSVQELNGGYFHEDGTYVNENSLVLTMLGVPEETVTEIAKDLCAFFHQESVMVTNAVTNVHFVHDTLDT